MKSFFIFFSVVAAIGVITGTDYCKMKCKDNETGKIVEHIGCRASYKFNSTNCPPNAKLIEMSLVLREYILHAHNEKRNKIAGGLVKKFSPACRMAYMKWDDELAKLAALNVQQCIFAHDHCHNTVSFPTSGQNIAIFSVPSTVGFDYPEEMENLVKKWYAESKDCTQSAIDSFPKSNGPSNIGQFTVMMGERNTRVGCAASTYVKNGSQYVLLTCNYATNNQIGKPVYKSCSKPAKDCTTGVYHLYRNLCSLKEIY